MRSRAVVARRPHKPKAAGANPASVTVEEEMVSLSVAFADFAGSSPVSITAEMEQKWLAVPISRRSEGANPSSATNNDKNN